MIDTKPSLLKIIWIDYWSFISAIFCVFAPGFYIYDVLFSGTFVQNFRWVALGLFFLSFFGLISRYISIISLYNGGIEANATISDIGFFRDRGYIKYIYPFENRKYASQVTVMKNKSTTRYRIGEEVVVIVDRENPKKSVIKDLFAQR